MLVIAHYSDKGKQCVLPHPNSVYCLTPLIPRTNQVHNVFLGGPREHREAVRYRTDYSTQVVTKKYTDSHRSASARERYLADIKRKSDQIIHGRRGNQGSGGRYRAQTGDPAKRSQNR